jgi:tripartite-type tricarboxylate transporter receptor subunit TctC
MISRRIKKLNNNKLQIGQNGEMEETVLQRMLLTATAAAAALAVMSTSVIAQDYPKETIRLIAPFGPGGGTDLTARIAADKLSQIFGWKVIVENKPGAASQVGISYVARAKPDGYTILWTSADMTVLPAVQESTPYTIPDDFEFITSFCSFPLILAVNSKLPINNFKEFIEYAKAHPGEMNYSSSGAGGGGHLHPANIAYHLGLNMVHVPYKDAAAAAVAVSGGHVHASNVAPSTIAPYIKDGSVRPIATSGRERTQLFPDVPTFAEQGYPQFTVDFFYGVYAPKGTPKEIVERLGDAIGKVLAEPGIPGKLLALGFGPLRITGKEFEKFVVGEVDRWHGVVENIGFKKTAGAK